MAEEIFEQGCIEMYDDVSQHTDAKGIHAELFPTGVALCSIAISLKRIADALTVVPEGNENLYDFAQDLRNHFMPFGK